MGALQYVNQKLDGTAMSNYNLQHAVFRVAMVSWLKGEKFAMMEISGMEHVDLTANQ